MLDRGLYKDNHWGLPDLPIKFAGQDRHRASCKFIFKYSQSLIMRQDSRLDNGTYKGYRVYVKLIRKGNRKYQPRRMGGPREVYEFFKPLESMDREVFYTLHLDSSNQIIACEEVSKGSLGGSIVHPREVYKAAILSSAASIIVAHNHPSGDIKPSAEDHSIEKRLYEAGELLGIPLTDSLIIGRGQYYSMKENGDNVDIEIGEQ